MIIRLGQDPIESIICLHHRSGMASKQKWKADYNKQIRKSFLIKIERERVDFFLVNRES